MLLYEKSSDLQNNQELIASKIFAYDLSRFPYLEKIKEKYLQDTLYTLRFLSISIEVDEPLLYVNYMKWFGQLAYYLKFNLKPMQNHFEACSHIFSQMFEPSLFEKINNTFHLGVETFETSFSTASPMDVKMDVFLDDLLHMRIEKAYQYVTKKIEDGMDIKDVYLNLFQPTLYKVGELWQQRIISVAKEHYVTAAIQNMIGRLYSKLFTEKKSNGYRITAVSAGEELHEIGMRMIADFFEISGWDSIYLGSNLPIQTIIDQLIEYPTDILAISSTTSSHLIRVRDLIHKVKSHENLKHVKILVGGKVFNDTPNLWKTIGADGYALTPEQAILIGNLLVGETNVKNK